MNTLEYPHLMLEVDPEINAILIKSCRYWVQNPISGEKETIQDQWQATTSIYCPNCNALGLWRITVTPKHTVISCESCQKHSWCRSPKKEEDAHA